MIGEVVGGVVGRLLLSLPVVASTNIVRCLVVAACNYHIVAVVGLNSGLTLVYNYNEGYNVSGSIYGRRS